MNGPREPEVRHCPFCGKKAAVDTLKYAGGKPALYRVQCLECKTATAWYDTEAAAWEAWNKRVSGGMNFAVDKDIFILDGLLFRRSQFTGNCTAQKERGGKSVRVREEVFLEAYEKCKKVTGA
jgi:Lar family restriction alleviation protein